MIIISKNKYKTVLRIKLNILKINSNIMNSLIVSLIRYIMKIKTN
jgi:hypothetical protein